MPSSCHKQTRDRSPPCRYCRIHPSEPKLGVFGENHPDTFRFMKYLTTTCRKQAKKGTADAIQAGVWKFQKEDLGLSHPDTILSMVKLADKWYDQGRYAEATSLQSKVLEPYRARLGIKHYDRLGLMNSLTRAHQAQGRLNEADEIYAQVLQLWEKTLWNVRHK